jgi:hypothetical protein
MVKDYTLLKISYDPSKVYGNWNYPHMIDNIIVRKSEADVIWTMCKNYKSYTTGFCNGQDFFDIPLSDFKVEYINDGNVIAMFKSTFGDRLLSSHLYDWLSNGIKNCYRENIEKSIDQNSYYDPEGDDLRLYKLKIEDDKVIIDPLQSYFDMYERDNNEYANESSNDDECIDF